MSQRQRFSFYSILAENADFSVEEGCDGQKEITIPISKSLDGDRIVYVVTEFSEMLSGEQRYWELSFGFEVISLSGSFQDFRTQDRDDAAPFIPEELRCKIIGLVADSAAALVKHTSPGSIYWVTKGGSLPDKAMQKYYTILDRILPLGYEVAQYGTDQAGRRFCIVRKTPGQQPPDQA
jgi:hypothetical protein